MLWRAAGSSRRLEFPLPPVVVAGGVGEEILFWDERRRKGLILVCALKKMFRLGQAVAFGRKYCEI
jgi:hypothetical protein